MKSTCRRSPFRLLQMLVACLFMVGCGAASSAPASSPPSAPAASSASAPPASAGVPSSASAAGPIKVGVIETLTGSLAEIGKDNEDGFNLYLASVNGTMAGRKIEPIFVDDTGQADVGLTKARQLVENDKVQVLMGVIATPTCNGVATYSKQAQIPVIISGSCGDQTLMINPKLKSPYMVRMTQNNVAIQGAAADWTYKAGYRKAIIMMSNYNAGIDAASAFANTFVQRGGSILQEFYPPIGTTDFGPYLAQFDSNADALIVFLLGTDSVRFGEQFANYSAHKLQIIDSMDALTTGTNLEHLKDKLVGAIGTFPYVQDLDTPANTAFVKAFEQKYKNRPVSSFVASGYDGAHFLQAALEKVNGKIEDKQQFLQALYSTQIDGVRGPVKLDQDHDVVQNVYVYKVVKNASSYAEPVVDTYKNVSKNGAMSDQELLKFPFEQLKGKWAGMTPAKLAQASKP